MIIIIVSISSLRQSSVREKRSMARILQKAISLEPRPNMYGDSYTDVKNCASFKETCYP